MPSPRAEVREELRKALNMHGWDSRTETPDFVLAEYLTTCLEAYLYAQSVRRFRNDPEDLLLATKGVHRAGAERLEVVLPVLEHPGLADLPALVARLDGWIGDLAPTSPHQQMRDDLEACRTMAEIMEGLRRPGGPLKGVTSHG